MLLLVLPSAAVACDCSCYEQAYSCSTTGLEQARCHGVESPDDITGFEDLLSLRCNHDMAETFRALGHYWCAHPSYRAPRRSHPVHSAKEACARIAATMAALTSLVAASWIGLARAATARIATWT